MTYNKTIEAIHMPPQIKRLPISPQGYPVPWFVAWFKDGKPCAHGEGEPDFRVADTPKFAQAMKRQLCWTCGEPIGVYKAFNIGPMCAINRVISEPPSHRSCAEFSATACPFLSKPRMRRNEADIPEAAAEPGGVMIRRNPGAVCVWITRTYKTFNPPGGGLLFEIGPPEEVLWFAEGRKATRAEVVASIESGYPILEDMAAKDGPVALAMLKAQRERAMTLVPAA